MTERERTAPGRGLRAWRAAPPSDRAAAAAAVSMTVVIAVCVFLAGVYHEPARGEVEKPGRVGSGLDLPLTSTHTPGGGR